jgi:hypothetical protein
MAFAGLKMPDLGELPKRARRSIRSALSYLSVVRWFLAMFALKYLRSALFYFSVAGFIWGIANGAHGLIAMTVVMLTMRGAHIAIDRTATRCVTRGIVEHEDVLCSGWRGNRIFISFADGRTVFAN